MDLLLQCSQNVYIKPQIDHLGQIQEVIIPFKHQPAHGHQKKICHLLNLAYFCHKY